MSNTKKCNFHLYLGKKDYEILLWKKSLPPKCFKFYVEQIILSYINGYQIILPPVLEVKEVPLKTSPIHIVIENEQVISFLDGIGSGDKSKAVKEILLFYIRESRDNSLVGIKKKTKKKTAPPIYNTPSSQTKSPSVNVCLTNEPLNTKDDKKNSNGGIRVSDNVQTNITQLNQNNSDKNKQSDNRINVEKNSNNNPPPQNNTQQTSKAPAQNNPLLQSLLKMSGDE